MGPDVLVSRHVSGTPAHVSAETSYPCEQDSPRRPAGVEGVHFHSRDILLDPLMETP